MQISFALSCYFVMHFALNIFSEHCLSSSHYALTRTACLIQCIHKCENKNRFSRNFSLVFSLLYTLFIINYPFSYLEDLKIVLMLLVAFILYRSCIIFEFLSKIHALGPKIKTYHRKEKQHKNVHTVFNARRNKNLTPFFMLANKIVSLSFTLN